jgi:thiamine biosynthesis lipoprotein
MKNPDEPKCPAVLPNRRDFITMGLGAFLVATLPRAARPARRLIRRNVPMMGSIAELAVVDRDARHAYAALDAALNELRRVERAMTRFDPDSDVGRANARASSEPVAVSEPTAHVLREALRWAVATGGAFDPALARATELWDVEHRRVPPARRDYARFAGRHLHEAVGLDRWRGRAVVAFEDPDVGIDLGGIAKGYGVDRAVEALRAWGVTSALVNVGGDLYALGSSEDGDEWEIGIRSPEDPSRLKSVIRIEDRAVATSGDYERYFDYGDRRFHHLIDPATGAPRVTVRHTITAMAPTCLAADAAATAAFGSGPEAAARMAAAGDPGVELVDV